jgi:hypothetical protein
MTGNPFTNREHATIAEVFALYGLSPARQRGAWQAIAARWRETSGRFYAYAVAHEIAASAEAGKFAACKFFCLTPTSV